MDNYHLNGNVHKCFLVIEKQGMGWCYVSVTPLPKYWPNRDMWWHFRPKTGIKPCYVDLRASKIRPFVKKPLLIFIAGKNKRDFDYIFA